MQWAYVNTAFSWTPGRNVESLKEDIQGIDDNILS